jgi:hypothetical protein
MDEAEQRDGKRTPGSDASTDLSRGADSPRDGASEARQQFRLRNVLYVVIPIGLLVCGGFLFVSYFQGLERLADWSRPPLVAAEGRVLYRGEPLANAQLATRPLRAGTRGAMGWTDDLGYFRLQTDLNGYVEGAFAGEHQVVVTAYERLNAPAAPPLVTPDLYASFATTPLRIVVSPTPEKNVFEFALQGEPPPRRSRRNPAGAAPSGEAAAVPADATPGGEAVVPTPTPPAAPE